MIALKTKFKIQYFDRSIVRTNWRKINRGPMSKAGNFVKVIAKRSIRRAGKSKKTGRRTRKPSPAGRPPKTRAAGDPFRLIFSIPVRGGTSAVVGMVGFKRSRQPTPGLHEHGGRVQRTLIERTGGGREKKTGRFRKSKTRGRWVTRQGQRRFIPKKVTKMVSYPVRDFMKPALIKAAPKLPTFWLNSLPRAG